MPKPVAAQMFTPIPARHYDDMIVQTGGFQLPQNHESSAAFAIIILKLHTVTGKQSP